MDGRLRSVPDYKCRKCTGEVRPLEGLPGEVRPLERRLAEIAVTVINLQKCRELILQFR